MIDRASQWKCTECPGAPVTMDGANGFRCAAHPPGYNRVFAAKAVEAGYPADASAHRRTHIALLAERIQRRNP